MAWDREADDRLRAALAKAETNIALKGLPVFPCRERAKEPLTAHGCKDATVDLGQLRAWRERWPRANIGIACGGTPRLLVVDVDGDEGEGALRALEAEHAALPPTVETITPGGGRHVYLRYPADTDLGCSVGTLAVGIDTRATGGYVLAPPSVHPSGRRYAWSVDSAAAIADAPAWLIERLRALGAGSSNGQARPAEEWLDVVTAGIDEGRRNAEMTRVAGLLLRRLPPEVAVQLAACFNLTKCRPPLPAVELKKILDSVATREMKRRGLPHGDC